jgi:hypothetical protein
LKGYIRGVQKAKLDKEFTLKVISRYTKVEEPDLLEETYRKFVLNFDDRLYYSRPGMQFLLDQLARRDARAASAKPEAFVDMSLVYELEKESFLK